MESIEFTYHLTEDDYVKAAEIKVKIKASHPWSKVLSRIYLALLLFVIWFSMIIGRILAWLDITGDKLGKLSIGDVLLSSILPTAILLFLFILLIRILLLWPKKLQRREQYRNSAQCQVATTVKASPERIAFRSEQGSSESQWKCYAGWAAQDEILVLQTFAGVRQILKIPGLNQDQRAEFIRILNAAMEHAAKA